MVYGEMLQRHQPMPDGVMGQTRQIIDAQLAGDVLVMSFDGLGAELEKRRDSLGAKSSGVMTQHLPFTRGEHLRPRRRAIRAKLVHSLGQSTLTIRAQKGVASHDHGQRLGQARNQLGFGDKT